MRKNNLAVNKIKQNKNGTRKGVVFFVTTKDQKRIQNTQKQVENMDDKLILQNNLRDIRIEKNISQQQLADMVGVSRNTISSIETGQFNPTAKLALILCVALDKKFEDIFYF